MKTTVKLSLNKGLFYTKENDLINESSWVTSRCLFFHQDKPIQVDPFGLSSYKYCNIGPVCQHTDELSTVKQQPRKVSKYWS